ncbi:YniB family protein [Aeromonas media]|uniref:YniB family protein n=1 Tax=Aeromonas media TaxID=651 RepID=UPI00370B2013
MTCYGQQKNPEYQVKEIFAPMKKSGAQLQIYNETIKHRHAFHHSTKFIRSTSLNFREARKKSIQKRLLGVTIIVPSVISTVISFLKMVFFRLDDGTHLGGMIARPLKEMINWVYQNTQYLSLFWEKSPTPNHMVLSEPHNLYSMIIYLLIFVGFAFYTSGAKLALRLAEINEKIENQLIEESIKGAKARSREEIEFTTAISSISIFSQLHQLYFAPVVTAVIGAVIIKFIGV